MKKVIRYKLKYKENILKNHFVYFYLELNDYIFDYENDLYEGIKEKKEIYIYKIYSNKNYSVYYDPENDNIVADGKGTNEIYKKIGQKRKKLIEKIKNKKRYKELLKILEKLNNKKPIFKINMI